MKKMLGILCVTSITLVFLFVNAQKEVDNKVGENSEVHAELQVSDEVTLGTTSDSKFGVKDIANGYYHSIILTTDGKIYTAGQNTDGQLGTGQTGSGYRKTTYTEVVSGGGFINDGRVVAIGAGAFTSYFITNEGVAYSFGRNDYYQLGIGNTTAVSAVNKPTKLDFSSAKVKKIDGGLNYGMLLTENNEVYVFGKSDAGQFCNGSYSSSSTPIKVPDYANSGFVNANLKDAQTGHGHLVLLDSNGIAYTCGANGTKQLGRNSGDVRYPFKVEDTADFTNNGGIEKISSVNAQHTLILKEGVVYGFGQGDFRQFGNATTATGSLTVKVSGADNGFVNQNIVEIDTGYQHTLMRNAADEVYGCGYQVKGALGNGTTAGYLAHPTKIIENARLVSAGASSTIIFTNDGNLYAAGRNADGQLALGYTSDQEAKLKQSTDFDSFSYSLTGKALEHGKNVTLLKYTGDVILSDVIGGNVTLTEEGGTAVDITSIISASDEYVIGEHATSKVNLGEEKKFKLQMMSTKGEAYSIDFVVDKKPPTLQGAVGQENNCNDFEGVLYCNVDINLVTGDLSGIHKIMSDQVDLTEIYNTNGYVGQKFANYANLNEELPSVEYEVVDGAGNMTIVYVTLDNYVPRIEIK